MKFHRTSRFVLHSSLARTGRLFIKALILERESEKLANAQCKEEFGERESEKSGTSRESDNHHS